MTLAAWSRGASIADLYSTGVGTDGTTLLSAGSADPHYRFVSGAQKPATDPQAEVESITIPWAANGPLSEWIGVTDSGNTYADTGQYRFATTFTLPTTADLRSTVLTLRLAADNDILEVDLNGSPTGVSENPPRDFNLSPSLTISSANGHFVAGANTLTFVALNEDHGGGANPFGIRVDSLHGTFSLLLPGDANGDGIVNFSDLLILSQHFGRIATASQGDFTGDGIVLFDDLLILAQHYGQHQAGVAATVPEPAIAGAAGVAVLLAGRRRPRRTKFPARATTRS